MRGQAFVVFRDVSSATIAKRQLDGFMFYGKQMTVNYAKNKSDAIAKLDGSIFEQLEQRKKKLLNKKVAAERMQLDQADADSSEELDAQAIHSPAQQTGPAAEEQESDSAEELEQDEGTSSTRRKLSLEQPNEPAQATKKLKTGLSDQIQTTSSDGVEHEPIPTYTLFMQNLPESVSNEMISALFEQYPGFKEVRRVPGNPHLAFVDYDTVHQASHARDVLNHFKISSTISLDITFAKF
ncbi:hypothetical protein BB561_001433 [Smittium simulii]|uniref:RRM domain-containing protein n=1 Tax=Smittium simulii TaxID=133385 RepID=A0A2T9YUN0_9FUNG|nr:hypothetical protein BB561_001433 [Smittium simulii]